MAGRRAGGSKGWRIGSADADGPLATFARRKIGLGRVRANWGDILRIVVPIDAGEVRACNVVRMLQRDGHPAALGEAIAMIGRIPKTLHICSAGRRGGLPARHQGHAQPPGRPPRPRGQDVARQEGRAV
ncbi:MAG: Tn3 family transposase [Streptosporangiaceae bacterium]